MSSNLFGLSAASFYALGKKNNTSSSSGNYVTLDTVQTITANKIFANLNVQNILGVDIGVQGNIYLTGFIQFGDGSIQSTATPSTQSYVTVDTTQTITGEKTFSQSTYFNLLNASIVSTPSVNVTTITFGDGSTQITATTNAQITTTTAQSGTYYPVFTGSGQGSNNATPYTSGSLSFDNDNNRMTLPNLDVYGQLHVNSSDAYSRQMFSSYYNFYDATDLSPAIEKGRIYADTGGFKFDLSNYPSSTYLFYANNGGTVTIPLVITPTEIQFGSGIYINVGGGDLDNVASLAVTGTSYQNIINASGNINAAAKIVVKDQNVGGSNTTLLETVGTTSFLTAGQDLVLSADLLTVYADTVISGALTQTGNATFNGITAGTATVTNHLQINAGTSANQTTLQQLSTACSITNNGLNGDLSFYLYNSTGSVGRPLVLTATTTVLEGVASFIPGALGTGEVRNLHTMPLASDTSTLVPTCGWVQSAIIAGGASPPSSTVFNGLDIAGNTSANQFYSVKLGNNIQYNGTGRRNIHLGYEAGKNVSSGQDNILIGAYTANALTTGANNVIIGNYAGGSNLFSGQNNILIGIQANNYNADTNNNIVIGNNGFAYQSSSEIILIGDQTQTQYIQGQVNHKSQTLTNTIAANNAVYTYYLPDVLPSVVYFFQNSSSTGVRMYLILPIMDMSYKGASLQMRTKYAPYAQAEMNVQMANNASKLVYNSAPVTQFNLGSNFYASMTCDGEYWYLNQRVG